eukprot:Em0019g262a
MLLCGRRKAKTRRLAAEWQNSENIRLSSTRAIVEVEPSPPSERPASKGLPLHVLCALELNEQLDAGVPRFRGATNVIALNDKRLPWQGQLQRLRGSDPEQCIEQLEQRIERLESEKLELSKVSAGSDTLLCVVAMVINVKINNRPASTQSLSAAHLLGALPAQQKGEEMQETELEHPHHFRLSFKGARLQNTQSDNGHRMSDHSPSITQILCSLQLSHRRSVTLRKRRQAAQPDHLRPSCVLSIHMLQLLDLCLRLDATEVELSADIQEEAENAMLRLLLDIAWKKVSEQSGT